MVKFSNFTFLSSDGGHSCYAALWQPEGETPRGVVQIVHGVAEHMGRYDRFARFLAEHCWAVCGEDHLGHGETGSQDGKFGYFGPEDGWELVTRDVRQLRLLMGERFPGAPYFLLGHSMGSFLTRTYLCRYPGTVDGAVLSGTGQESALLVGAGKVLAGLIARLREPEAVSPLVNELSLGAYNKKFRPNRTSADWISRDEKVVDAYLRDPWCTFTPTVGMFRDMLGGLQYIASDRALSQMDPDTPVYLFSGDQDPVGACGKGVRKVYGYFQRHGTKDLTIKLYPGGRHEMLNELNREEVYGDVLSWLDGHVE